MKIFMEGVHTSADWGIFMTGHTIETMDPWMYHFRPKPDNVKIVSSFNPDSYDVILGASLKFFDAIETLNKPVIWRNWGDFGKWTVDYRILKKCHAWVALNEEGIERHGLKGHPKAMAIPHCADPATWKGYDPDKEGVFTVGNGVTTRPEKGTEVLFAVSRSMRVDLLGWGNEGYPYWQGYSKDFMDLISKYQSYRIYLNPTSVVSGSCLDAMVMGIPVITMSPGNMKWAFDHGKTALIANDVGDMLYSLNFLIGRKDLCVRLGKEARSILSPVLSTSAVSEKWDKLFEHALSSDRHVC